MDGAQGGHWFPGSSEKTASDSGDVLIVRKGVGQRKCHGSDLGVFHEIKKHNELSVAQES